jgi:hypothetical protein
MSSDGRTIMVTRMLVDPTDWTLFRALAGLRGVSAADLLGQAVAQLLEQGGAAELVDAAREGVK